MKFSEFHVGQEISGGPYLVSQEEIVKFAIDFDPQWFHVDPLAASKGPFEGLIASGWHTCGIAMRLVANGPLSHSESCASPAWPM